jgi:hypothetical protein
MGKPVEVSLFRLRYKNNDHVRCFKGRLVDIGSTMICLENKKGRYRWIPKPIRSQDSIKILE